MNKNTDIPTELFELEKITDNPFFEGFALDKGSSRIGRASLDDDLTPGFQVSESSQKWEQVKLRETWVTPRVSGRVGSYNDFPGIDLVLPAFSQRACDVLSDMLEPNGELLPLKSQIGKYFFYNITSIVDGALDHQMSQCSFWCEPPTTATDIKYFAFRQHLLRGLSIFRICEWPMSIIVTEKFVDRVNDSGLNGFRFKKIWPFEKGVNWRQQAKITVPNSSFKLKQHTLVLILPLGGSKPNQIEARSIEHIEETLDSQLAISSLAADYFGRYEGSDIVNSEFRLFLSCPNADMLEQKLNPILCRLGWTVAGYLMKRYGSMWDPNVREVVRTILPDNISNT